jgi:ABC-type microcin C transport system duplicated ATPase subunit YejF
MKTLTRDLGLAMAFISHDLSVIRAVTRSQICSTTPRSWVTKTTAVRCVSCTLRMSRRICFCTVTSSAVVGSSATMILGSSAKAAIRTRWRIPPTIDADRSAARA